MRKQLFLFIVSFLVLEFFVFIFINHQYEKIEKTYHTNKLKHINDEYNIVLNSYKNISEIVVDNMVNTEEILSVIKSAYSEDTAVKTQARETLHKKLLKTYESLNSLGVEQFHFHLKTGESLLRLHRPEKYGDNIFPFRRTVYYTNTNRQYIQGFESGRVISGYRYVYPLFFKNEHIGSVEVSVSFDSIKRQLQKVLSKDIYFLIKKKKIDDKLFSELIKKHYKESEVADGYYREKGVEERVHLDPDIVDKLTTRIKPKVEEKIKEKEPFVIAQKVNGVSYLAMFLPVKEFLGDVEAYILFYTDRTIEDVISNDFKKDFLAISVILILVMVFLYKIFKDKKDAEERSKVEEREKRKVEEIFNAQSSMTLMIERGEIVNGNRAFLNYFDAESLEDFESDSKKLSMYFDNRSGISIDLLQKNDYEWLGKVFYNSENNYKVSIKERIFVVAANKILENCYIVTFTDITETIHYQKKLELDVAVAVEKIEKQHKEILLNAKKAAMGDMVGIIAHQLKQPLNVISMYAEDIEMDFNDGNLTKEGMKEFVETAKERIKFMSNSIDNYKNFFNPNKKKQSFSMKTAIEKTISIIDLATSNRNIKLDLELEDILIDGCENDFIQVVMNIIANARDALVENRVKDPYIKVKLYKLKDKSLLFIKDNGGGIKEDIIDKIFDSYFSTKSEHGTGIGLNLAKMVIEDSFKGKITAENDDIGAKFTIEI